MTTPERQALEADAAQTDKAIDLLGAYDRVVGRSSRDSEDRHDVMVEAFEDSENEGKDDETYAEEWQEPKELDMAVDEDRQAAMAAAMEDAA